MRELSRREVVVLGTVGALAAACGTPNAPGSGSGSRSDTKGGAAAPSKPGDDMSVDPPGKLTDSLLSSDILVYSQNSLDEDTIARIKAIKGVEAVESIAMGSFYVADRQVTYAAVDLATFPRFTDRSTAQTPAVWDRVAGGEIAVEPVIGKQLEQKDGYMRLNNEAGAETIHIGAYAAILPSLGQSRIDAVVNTRWTDKLGMREDNALIVALGVASPASILKELKRYVGQKAQIEILAQNPKLNAARTAFLTGGSVAAAVGSFSYRPNPDGTVVPDPKWVAANIRTEQMPIIGRVTGHRVMLPQLRGALNQIASNRLSSKIHTYDGCYVPRFIAHNPARGLSFHTFGTAIDLNASTNYRGIAGDIDRRVVAIFKSWGFAWGGDWNYTDPMHFELAELGKPR